MQKHTLYDQHHRPIHHLRISLTDQCDFRCMYCMPPEGVSYLNSDKLLNNNQITRLAKVFLNLGIQKIRLTGGEPLLRKDILPLVHDLAGLNHLDQLALTTNGNHLAKLAKPLADAGLKRINISLDSLDNDNFARLTKRQRLSSVLHGIHTALDYFPVKVNVVILKGVNDHEIPDFIQWALDHPLQELRFIEFMPLCGTGWKPQHVCPMTNTIEDLIQNYGGELINQEKDSVAESYHIHHKGKKARVGFIRTMSKPFCGHCSRIRLSADGTLRPCLFSHNGTSLKKIIEQGANDEAIIKAIQDTVWQKPIGNDFFHEHQKNKDKPAYLNPESQQTSYPAIRSIGG